MSASGTRKRGGSPSTDMETRIRTADQRTLSEASALIRAGEVVAFHTETVYGLGANAFSDDAVRKIFQLKGRPADNPLIVHVHPDYDLAALIDGEPPYAAALRKAFLPGPLTMVYPSAGKVSRFVSCGLDTLAVRVPRSPVAQAFLRAAGLPIAAPSANVSKHVSPVSAAHVFDDFNGKIPLILDGGECDGGIESTVLDCTESVPRVLREGLVTREMIAAVAGDCRSYTLRKGERPKSPGMAYRHYAPRCRTAYCKTAEEALALCRAEEGTPVVLCESRLIEELPGVRTLDLGATGEEMARRLYSLLRKGEACATLLIAVEPTETGGVMAGVMNRLKRAFGRE